MNKGELDMERIIEILTELKPGVDYETCKELIDGRHLDSLTILSLVAELEEEYDIIIPTVEIVPDNFNSVEALWEMVERLKEDD